jgi:hypothetical protein
MSYLLDSRKAPAMVSKTIVWLVNFLEIWSYTIHGLTDRGRLTHIGTSMSGRLSSHSRNLVTD